jgi:hypothetical protein
MANFQPVNLAQIYGAVDNAKSNQIQLENQRMQQQRYQMEMQQAQRAQQESDAVKGVYRGAVELDETGSPRLNEKKLLSELYGVAPEQALKTQESFTKRDAESAKTKRENQKAELENRVNTAKYLRDKIASVTDDNSYKQVLAEAQELGATGLLQSAPAQFDPEWQRSQLFTADKFLEQSTPKYEKVDLGGKIQIIDVNPMTNPSIKGANFTKTQTLSEQESARHNRVAEGISGAQLGVSRDRLAFDRSGGATGVVPAAGKPIKLTEDQGKATGWLSQANNAYANMKAAMTNEDGTISNEVVSPGGTEAALNNLGFEGSANYLRSPKRQQFVQANETLGEALLRAATGAGVNKDEAKQKAKELMPQWSDSQEVKKQKLDAIPVYLDSLKVRAGAGAGTLQNNQDAAAVTFKQEQPTTRGQAKSKTVKNGTIAKSKSGRPIVYMNGGWEFVNGK